MVKKSAVMLGILAILLVGAGISMGYTVSQWPVPGIPNTTYGGTPCLVGPGETGLRGPVAPSCEGALVPGLIHAAASAPFRVLGFAFTPMFTRELAPPKGCCDIQLGEPAYVTAAVPCTAVNRFVPPCGLCPF